MPRNFHRRVEVMFPIEAPGLKRRILTEVIPTYLRDNVKARLLRPDGNYARLQPPAGEPLHRSQEEFLAMRPAPAEPVSGNGAENGESRHGMPVGLRSSAPG
jgi:polyphosphate kinase